MIQVITESWPWLGAVLIVGLVSACAAVAVRIFSDVQEEIDKMDKS